MQVNAYRLRNPDNDEASYSDLEQEELLPVVYRGSDEMDKVAKEPDVAMEYELLSREEEQEGVDSDSVLSDDGEQGGSGNDCEVDEDDRVTGKETGSMNIDTDCVASDVAGSQVTCPDLPKQQGPSTRDSFCAPRDENGDSIQSQQISSLGMSSPSDICAKREVSVLSAIKHFVESYTLQNATFRIARVSQGVLGTFFVHSLSGSHSPNRFITDQYLSR